MQERQATRAVALCQVIYKKRKKIFVFIEQILYLFVGVFYV
jgi:hypothetical protein